MLFYNHSRSPDPSSGTKKFFRTYYYYYSSFKVKLRHLYDVDYGILFFPFSSVLYSVGQSKMVCRRTREDHLSTEVPEEAPLYKLPCGGRCKITVITSKSFGTTRLQTTVVNGRGNPSSSHETKARTLGNTFTHTRVPSLSSITPTPVVDPLHGNVSTLFSARRVTSSGNERRRSSSRKTFETPTHRDRRRRRWGEGSPLPFG